MKLLFYNHWGISLAIERLLITKIQWNSYSPVLKKNIINPFVFIATKRVLCNGPCFYIASKPESSFFSFTVMEFE
jgi:hypothetical protein